VTRALLIDGGQSGLRAALQVDGATVARETLPGLARAGRSWEPVRALVRRFDADVVAAGLSGYDGADLGVPIIVASDAVTAHLGALGGEPGAVIVAGTGAIALAASADGWARADGWGPLLGDAGGGYWIARRALARALRAHDGRGGSAALRAAAERRFGPLASIARVVYDARDPVATVAAFAVDVAELAAGGGADAAAILTAAGKELARTVTAALNGAPSCPRRVSWAGGVFGAGPLILDALRAELEADVVAPLGDGLAGAARLLERPALFSGLIHGP
jgi:N-acetylglucosamine kinase-like BadF-type ATPase